MRCRLLKCTYLFASTKHIFAVKLNGYENEYNMCAQTWQTTHHVNKLNFDQLLVNGMACVFLWKISWVYCMWEGAFIVMTHLSNLFYRNEWKNIIIARLQINTLIVCVCVCIKYHTGYSQKILGNILWRQRSSNQMKTPAQAVASVHLAGGVRDELVQRKSSNWR